MTMPLRFNPFSVGPISNDDLKTLFVNRHNELMAVRRFVRFRETGIVLVTGDRGTGKSSFLSKLAHDMDKDVLVVEMSVSHFDADKIGFLRGVLLTLLNRLESTEPAMVRQMRRRVEKVLYKREEKSREYRGAGADVLGVGREKEVTLMIDPDIYHIEEALQTTLRECTKRFGKIVMLVDDLDKISPDVASSLLLMVRPLLSIRGVFWVIVVGRLTMQHLAHEIEIARSISDLEILLGPLVRSDSIGLVQKRLARAGSSEINKIFHEDALEAILGLSNGNPRELIKICGDVLDDVLQKSRPKLEYSDVARVLEEQGATLFSHLQEREVGVLRFIGERGTVNAGDARLSDNLHLSRPRVSQILNKLCRMGFLVRVSTGKHVLYSISEHTRQLIAKKTEI